MLRKRDYNLNFYTGLISISLILFLLGIFAIISITGRVVVNSAKEELEVKIMLQPGTSSDFAYKLVNQLKKSEYVLDARYVSQDQALNELQELGEDFKKEVIGDISSYFSSVNVKIKNEYSDKETLQKIMKDWSKLENVREVNYPVKLIEIVNARSATFIIISSILGSFLIFVAYLLIMNTIRLDIYSKRLMIRTMQLIGATSEYIRKPFLQLGTLQGFFGSLIAIVLIMVLLITFTLFVADLGVIIFSKEFLFICIFLIAFGTILGYFSSLVAVNRYLDKKLEDII